MKQNADDLEKGVWFIYDGHCPLCCFAAQALRIQQNCGELHLIDAREKNNDQTNVFLLERIKTLKFDLNQGMLIYYQGQFYHGAKALHFMAVYGAPKGFFNRLNRMLFKSQAIASFTYPFLRAIRNTLLHLLGRTKINDEPENSASIFEQILSPNHWHQLPKVLQKHYKNKPYSSDQNLAKGRLDVYCRSYMKLLKPFFRYLKIIPLVDQKNVDTTVYFKSHPDNDGFYFQRVFYFADQAYTFNSCMIYRNQEIIEKMRWGFCWRINYFWDGHSIQLQHKGYAFMLKRFLIPLPLTILLGRCNASETAIDDEHFAMQVKITHPWWGDVYGYSGHFKMME